MQKILITGANGLIGQHLTKLLLQEGYAVAHLVRTINSKSTVEQFTWDPTTKKLDESVFKNVDHVIHLAGENLSAGRWTQKRKTALHASRIESAQLLFKQSQNSSIQSFITASGISIYGTETVDKIFTEEDKPALDFLAQLTVDWEKAADQFAARNVRVVKLRTAVVLASNGGALQQIAGPIRKGLGAVLGSGKQYFPWIHIDDLCHIYLNSIRNTNMHGAYHAVAPEHCTNQQLTREIAAILGKKIWLPSAPAFVLKAAFGEMANLILKGSRMSSEKIQQSGFVFQYPHLKDALENCLKK